MTDTQWFLHYQIQLRMQAYIATLRGCTLYIIFLPDTSMSWS